MVLSALSKTKWWETSLRDLRDLHPSEEPDLCRVLQGQANKSRYSLPHSYEKSPQGVCFCWVSVSLCPFAKALRVSAPF